jgi:RNA polymerase sigma-70 factor (ECF subfamily)
LERILNNLPEQQRMAFQMRDIEGFDYEEIAEVMEVSKNNVRVALSRARKKMREELTKSRVYG